MRDAAIRTVNRRESRGDERRVLQCHCTFRSFPLSLIVNSPHVRAAYRWRLERAQ
jgi:hypothetical protein